MSQPSPPPPPPARLRLGTAEALQHLFLKTGAGAGNLVVRMSCRTTCKISKSALQRSLLAVQMRHPLLQYHTVRSGRHVYAVHKPGVPLVLDETADSWCATEDELHLRAREAHERLGRTDFRNQPLAAVAWFEASDGSPTMDGAPCNKAELVLAIGHAICDARSALSLALELAQLLALAATSRPADTSPEELLRLANLPPLPLPPLLAKRMHPGVRGVRGVFSSLSTAVHFAKQLNSLCKANMILEPEKMPTDAPPASANQWMFRSCAAQPVRDACRAHGTTVHHLLATCLSVAFVERQIALGKIPSAAAVESLPMAATLDLRPRQEPPCPTKPMELVYVVGSAFLNVPLGEGGLEALQQSDDCIWETAAQAKQLLETQIAEYAPWKLMRTVNLISAAAMERKIVGLLEAGAAPTLANAGYIPMPESLCGDGERNPPAVQPTGLFYQLVITHGLLSIAASTFNDKLSLVFSWGSFRVSSTTVEAIVDRMMALLQRVIAPNDTPTAPNAKITSDSETLV